MGGGSEPQGTLYVVGTPIGNLDDLSRRAIETLAGSDLVACEDTRRTRILLARNGLKKRLVSYHAFNESHRLTQLLDALRRGERIALVCDGGTPGISDPGAVLVRAARGAGHRVVPIPGASALTALLSVSGFDPGPFTFVGFLPHRKGERRRTLQSLSSEVRPLLFFESPRRCLAALEDALDILGDRAICLGREMTKLHEEFLVGTIGNAIAALGKNPPRGEVAFLLSGRGSAGPAGPSEPGTAPSVSPARRVRELIASGTDRKEALRRVSRETGRPRRDLYRELVRLRQEEE